MAGFKTHISISSLAGIAYGTAAHHYYDVEPTTAAVAAGLCGVAGIVPDVDSDSGQTVRELMGFSAAVIPLLLIDHLKSAGLSQDGLVLAGGCLYVIIRFGLGEILKRYTVHRGMWHSIPAALIAGLVTSFIASCDSPSIRLFKVGAVILGYMIHLTLDELYSIQLHHGRIRFKKSFGTALKLWGSDIWSNSAVFAKLAALVYLTVQDPMLQQPAATPTQPTLTREVIRHHQDTPWGPLERR